MSLSSGTKVGPYEVLHLLGVGGMGEVYRARDTRLGREVAIKAMPEMFTADAERVARFQREAQILAVLNHPHIAGIHGLEDADGARFLVLELVEGESLADRLKRGALPVAEALAIARQIIDALEAAHEKGIIHRDLKPANIMIADNDRVKVLDFGLAKIVDGSGKSPMVSQSPTITTPAMMTGVGVVLGTAAYMSPEQAKGRPADKRSDVWAFGCVLYEMLTGCRAFDAEDVSETLAAILRGEPDWSALPPEVPSHVGAILAQCLTKDRKLRIPDIAVARYLLDQTTSADKEAVASSAHPRRRTTLAWQTAAALLLLSTIAATAAWYRARSTTPAVTRFAVPPPDNTVFASGSANRIAASAAVSPDGRKMAFTARDKGDKVLLWVRPIDSTAAQPLPGTEGAAYPFWSPDSRFIGYSTTGKLMKVAASGGPSQTICASSGPTIVPRGGAWSRDGVIVFGNGPGPLFRVPAGGGTPTTIGSLPSAEVTMLAFPSFLPDGRNLLAYGGSATTGETSGVYVVSLDGGASKRLFASDSGAVFSTDGGGYVLFSRQGTLLAQPFDAGSRTLRGEALAVADRVEPGPVPGFVSFSVSATGVLAYGTAAATDQTLELAWVDRRGQHLQTVGPPASYLGIDLSPDGTRVAAHHHERLLEGDIWVSELKRGTTSRFTFDAKQENSSPIWSHDGAFIVFGSMRGGKWGLYRKAANNSGADELLLEADRGSTVLPESVSPDGASIVYTRFSTLPPELWLLPLSSDRKPTPLVSDRFVDAHGQVSPDGKWLAYGSTETGRMEVFVKPFPEGAGKWQLTSGGGAFPRWRGDGRELFYVAGGKMVAVDIPPTPSFEPGPAKSLFDASSLVALIHGGPYHPYAVARDGERFLMPGPPAGANQATAPVVVVLNWAASLRID